jgi:hypothetical protein
MEEKHLRHIEHKLLSSIEDLVFNDTISAALAKSKMNFIFYNSKILELAEFETL